MAKLGEVCDFYAGTGFPNEYQGRVTGKYPFYKVGDISKNVLEGNRELKTCANYVEEDVVQKLKGSILPPKTIVFAKIGEALKLNRRAITSCECLVDNNVMGIKAQNVRLNDEYLFYWLQNLNLSDYSESTTVPSVKKSRLQNIEINVSPLEEQEKVVSTLNKLSSLILARKKQLSKLDELVKARFVEMFGESEYPCNSLISLIIEGAGLSYGIVQPGDDGTGDMGVLRPVDFADGKIKTDSIKYIDRSLGDGFKKTELNGNELLITVRGTTGITALTDSRFKGMNVTRGIAVIRYDKKKVDPIYLNEYIKMEKSQQYIKEHTRGATLQQINLSELRDLEIVIPPLPLQRVFAVFVERVDQQKQTVQQSLEKLELMKKALMQEYFG